MKTLFDTSALVAAIWSDHPQHSEAKAWLLRVRRGELGGAISQHTLLEAFAALTGMPSRPRLAPPVVRAAIVEAVKGFEIVALGPADYLSILERADKQDLTGGVVYDLLMLSSAERAGAEEVVTANVQDFSRLSSAETPRITPLT